MGRRLAWFVVCLALVTFLAGADTAAGASWTVQSLPSPSVPSGRLSAVSCPSGRSCVAVGRGPDGPLAERFFRGSWTLVAAPGGAGAGLTSVSCSSSTACTAVGATSLVSGAFDVNSVALAERWNGGGWTLERLAAPKNGRVSLNGVSCPSRRSCFAVGAIVGSKGRGVPLVERWNGSRWSIQRTPGRRLRPNFSSELDAVSCTSVKACTAVGRTFGKSLVERWSGSKWTLLKGSANIGPSAVSCSSATVCTVVGSGGNGSVVERIRGARESIKPIPDPGGEPDTANFHGLACTSARSCIAVGFFDADSTGDTAPVIERLRHGHWSIRAVRSAEATGGLSGVSCPARRSCTAVGDLSTPSTTFTWATHWNGSAFSTESTPSPSAPAAVKLNAVSCASSTSCIAVGQYTDTTGFDQTLAEAWNGAQWSIQATPNSSGLGDRKFNGVSCPTPTACVAVGSDDDGQLAESWNGTSWATLATPNVPGASLSAVSCTAASACTAVGPVDGESSPVLAERWDGTTWSVQSVPEPTADQGQLNAVSCASATACTAVGEFTNDVPAPGTLHPLAAAWNGAAWTLQTVPSPANEASFTSVSCTMSSACISVGLGFASTATTTLAEGWDGTTWSPQSIPDPTGGGTLSGVSCASAIDCTAVGNSASGSPVELADVWDGTTWTTQTLPSPTGSKFGSLTAVSCASSTDCIGVGSVDLGGPTSMPIAVRSG